MQQPLAIAVIGGLLANMLYTRLFIPVGYQVLGGAEGSAAKEVARRKGPSRVATVS